jgi:hypothetical protein
VIFIPVDLAVEVDQAPSLLLNRCGEGVERHGDSGSALAERQGARHRSPQGTLCNNLALVKVDLRGLLEVIVLDVPRADGAQLCDRLLSGLLTPSFRDGPRKC